MGSCRQSFTTSSCLRPGQFDLALKETTIPMGLSWCRGRFSMLTVTGMDSPYQSVSVPQTSKAVSYRRYRHLSVKQSSKCTGRVWVQGILTSIGEQSKVGKAFPHRAVVLSVARSASVERCRRRDNWSKRSIHNRCIAATQTKKGIRGVPFH